jgi:maltose-binding protein MalE
MKKIVFGCLGLICIIALTQCNNSDTKTGTTSETAEAQGASNTGVADNWKIGVQMYSFRMFTFTEALEKVDSAVLKILKDTGVSL